MKLSASLLIALAVLCVGAFGQTVSNAPTLSLGVKLPTIETNRGLVAAVGTIIRPSGGITYFLHEHAFGYGAGFEIPVLTLTTRYTVWRGGVTYHSSKMFVGGNATKNLLGLGFATSLLPTDHVQWWAKNVTLVVSFSIESDHPDYFAATLDLGYKF